MNAAERMLEIVNGAVKATLNRMAPGLTFTVVIWKQGEPDNHKFFACTTEASIPDGEVIAALRRMADVCEAQPRGV